MYDVHWDEQLARQSGAGDVCIVQEYINGEDLSRWARTARPTLEGIVTLVKEVVDGVGCAHQQGLVHRDLKPSNLLVDGDGHPHVADFGLAINESAQRLRKGEVSGTPQYMSPEQVRGLTHLLDGRSDLWSIGVILYELLTGCRPFGGADAAEIFAEVKHRDPRPPRQVRPKLPAELERICLKCLEKRQTDRHASAAELSEDLQSWLQNFTTSQRALSLGELSPASQPAVAARSTASEAPSSTGFGGAGSSSEQALHIMPKGLRSFDEHDADFFLQLLPGSCDRHGVPESIRFWKQRIEATRGERTFRIGLLYGPSGCGKSSLVKAGLLPLLAPQVCHVYVEATADDTELRLLRRLQHRLPAIPDDMSLVDVLSGLREGRWLTDDTKVCLVLDQFEQWLHAQRGQLDTELIQALRHCDGTRLQCLVLVRDDFWLAASRFMHELEVRLLEGHNSAFVDLFDPLHARKVLAGFGHAFGRLPQRWGDLSKEQKTFIKRAVDGLAEDGKIICVRLALLAEMLKGKVWTASTIAEVGGFEGLGVTFLEETFSAATAPAAHRYHERAASCPQNAVARIGQQY